MRVFERLRAIRAYEREHLGVLRTLEDFNLVREIGYHEARGEPLTLKQLFLLDTGSIATVQRRLRRLRQAGVIQQRRSGTDRRAVELRLSPRFRTAYRAYGGMLMGRDTVNGSQHACALYEDSAARAKMVGKFLQEGLRQGEMCVLVAAPGMQAELLGAIGEKRKQVLVTDGTGGPDAMLTLFKKLFSEAKAAGQPVRVAGDVLWGRAKGIADAALIDYEARLDALARQHPAKILCAYDAGQFDGRTILRALKAHRDTARRPLKLA